MRCAWVCRACCVVAASDATPRHTDQGTLQPEHSGSVGDTLYEAKETTVSGASVAVLILWTIAVTGWTGFQVGLPAHSRSLREGPRGAAVRYSSTCWLCLLLPASHLLHCRCHPASRSRPDALNFILNTCCLLRSFCAADRPKGLDMGSAAERVF